MKLFHEKNQILFWTIFLVIAFLAGYFGSWAYWAAFNRVNTNDLINYNPNSNVVIQQPRNVVVEQDQKAGQVITAVQGSLVGLFKKNNDGEYALSKNIAQALIVTSDGWLITNSNLITENNIENYVAITADRKVYELDQVQKGNASNFYFLHMQVAKGLPVLKFSAARNLRVGQMVLGINWFDSAWMTSVSQTDKNANAVKSSDASNQEVVLQEIVGKNNFVLADLSNNIIGLIDSNGRVKPMSFFAGAIQSLFLDNTVAYPILGVNYQNTALLVTNKLAKGALIISVDENSPAAKAGIIANDELLSVDGQDLDVNYDLADLISEHKTQDKINLSYSRDGEVQNVDVVLE
jgi:serine protease Do